jgi:hypothetical protein
LVAKEVNATKRPVAEIEGSTEASFPWVPSEATETRVVVPAARPLRPWPDALAGNVMVRSNESKAIATNAV